MSSLSLLTTNSKLDKSNKRFQNVLNVGLAMAPITAVGIMCALLRATVVPFAWRGSRGVR